MNLILLEAGEPDASGHVSLRGPRATHLTSVLNVEPGREVRVGMIDGPHGVGTVTSVAGGVVCLRCLFAPTVPPRPAVDLLLALPRPKVLRRLWAQLAALGVGRIILTNAERVERNYFDTHLLDPAGYRPLLVEGLQQARDTRLPIVSVHRQFRVLIEDELDGLTDTTVRLMAEPGAAAPVAARLKVDTANAADAARVLLAVGPEGGWNMFEQSLLADRGFHAVGMGPRTLRSDTACIALLALVHGAIGTGEGGEGEG